MGVNRDKPDSWKTDIAKSVDMYNDWFMKFAPKAFRETRISTTTDVEKALNLTSNFMNIKPEMLRKHPEILPTLRMATCPPLAADRLCGLAGVPANLVKQMEISKKLPPRMSVAAVNKNLTQIAEVFERMADMDILVWLSRNKQLAKKTEVHRAATIIADRLCGAITNPIIRNAQEKRQLEVIKTWLETHGYKQLSAGDRVTFDTMPKGTFFFHMNVPAKLESGTHSVNIPIDVVISPRTAKQKVFPIFFEAKSAGDFTNPNKRRKEEAMKVTQLRNTYGNKVSFNLFLCGYFDCGYLGYEAAEGIDWVWEHRMDDFRKFGI